MSSRDAEGHNVFGHVEHLLTFSDDESVYAIANSHEPTDTTTHYTDLLTLHLAPHAPAPGGLGRPTLLCV